jgi:predicted N-formylglutamate amidohydrolase
VKRVNPYILLTCEHGGNRIPRAYANLFRGQGAVLRTHRGYDIGAADVARRVARSLDVPVFVATVSRLVVDLNRSVGHQRVLSEMTRALSASERAQVFAEHYRPHRDAVTAAAIREIDRKNRVIHIAVHSFTPVLDGVRRNADVGLLYDPARPSERAVALAFRVALRARDPNLRVRMNYPYRGTADGFTTDLRQAFADTQYSGIEIELNQALLDERAGVRRHSEFIARSLAEIVASLRASPKKRVEV